MGATGGSTAAPTGGMPPPAKPMMSEPVMLMASWMGEGAGKKAAVKSGSDMVAQLDPGQPGVNDAVVAYLKGKKEGGAGKVMIMVPVDMPFDQVGQPLMKAAFRAGFKHNEVDYKPGAK